ncbi:MAG: carboxypeptidase-like regulatory domain-containing protein [Planctomycetaceae bacterium]|jgi:hypothetical protein|nr:carboxypeptidase-like regulatory domain-containing protein [Planctomycetaceae bacterium]
MNKMITIFILGVCLLLCLGCGNSNLDGLVPAKGVLKFNGQPVAGASVIFNPVDQTRSASGLTDANGNFTMMTLNPGDGVYPGEYIVTVTKIEYRGEMREEHSEGSRETIVHDTREMIEHLPSKYAAADTTDLKVTIPADGNKKIAFDLTGEVDTTPKKLKDVQRR